MEFVEVIPEPGPREDRPDDDVAKGVADEAVGTEPHVSAAVVGGGGTAAVLEAEGSRHPPPRLGGSGCQPTLPGLPASGHSALGIGNSGTRPLLPSVVRREVRACGWAPLGNEPRPCSVSCLRPPGGPGHSQDGTPLPWPG